MAAGLAQAAVGEENGVVFRSAGFVKAGRPATREAIEVMAEMGVDISQHRSALVRDVIGSKPDLIICMTRQHLRSTVEIDPSALSRTFTLDEIVELAERHVSRLESETASEFLGRISSRSISELTKANTKGDIADPIGQSIEVYRHCASELSHMVGICASLLWPTEDRARPASS
jgi:ribose 5-phosphate isomerase B